MLNCIANLRETRYNPHQTHDLSYQSQQNPTQSRSAFT